MSPTRIGPVELLILVLLVGLVAFVGSGELARWREREIANTIRADLLGFAAAQESYYYDRRVYAADPAAVEVTGFKPGAGVRLQVNEATLAGWSATASHRNAQIQCFLFVRAAAPVGSATVAGTVHCS